ncbi:hypothetical protein Vadar_010769 [Vaccinium darrowii]|uniref:Uncharacterized protein n=1 Tax=Vaccinium darrowii TaxID=229202 RepID=A0ACB7ZJG8_9ERIC|nr:hypothetical protein Vadar_010769 [Vaccinium darrowii]
MSDKQKGLIDSVTTLFPKACHRFCVKHLYNNFKGEFKGLVMKDILWKAARASIAPHFKRAMEETKAVNVKAYDWLCERPPVHWRNGTDLWSETDDLVMLPLNVKKRSGRPKKARRREPEEVQDPTKLSKRGVKMRRSACGKVAHNKRGCKKV